MLKKTHPSKKLLLRAAKRSSRKLLFKGKWQPSEDQILLNMSAHGLKVRWMADADYNASIDELAPVDLSHSSADILKKMKWLSNPKRLTRYRNNAESK